MCVQSMQAKQRCLLERVDALDEECEELQRQLGQWDERERDLKHQLQRVSEGKEELQAQLSAQQVAFIPHSFWFGLRHISIHLL